MGKNHYVPYMSYKEMDELAEVPLPAQTMYFNLALQTSKLRKQGAFRGIGLEITQGDIIRQFQRYSHGIKECIDAHKDINEKLLCRKFVFLVVVPIVLYGVRLLLISWNENSGSRTHELKSGSYNLQELVLGYLRI